MSAIISEIKKLIYSPLFKASYRVSKQDFSRSGKLSFPLVILFQLSLLRLSLQSESDNFFGALSASSTTPDLSVSAAALCKARHKVKSEAFQRLSHHLSDLYYSHSSVPLWHGHRLVAVDGSTFNLPSGEAIAESFGGQHQSGKLCPMAQGSFAYDPYSRVLIDALIAPYKRAEQDLLARHTDRFRAGDLILADRGYTGFWLMALLISKGCGFCIRHNTTQSYKKIEDFLSSGKRQDIVELAPTGKSRPRLEAHGLKAQRIRLRLIRIELSTGPEVLVTNLLDFKEYPYQEFGDLYHLRWPVEEAYKSFKRQLQVENFSAKSPEGITRDFYAKAFMLSLSGLFEQAAKPPLEEKQREANYKYARQVNRSALLNTLKTTFVRLWIKAADIGEIVSQIINRILKNLLPVRPQRSAPRNHKSPPRFYFNTKAAF